MFFVSVIVVQLLLRTAFGFSHHSSILDDGRPILRMLPDVDEQAISDQTSGVSSEREGPSAASSQPGWITTLLRLLDRLVQRYGFHGAQPLIQRAVAVPEGGKSRVNKYKFAPVLRQEAPWLQDTKEYIEQLVLQYGRENLNKHITPVMEKVQKAHNVYIEDIDGKVQVTYNLLKNMLGPVNKLGQAAQAGAQAVQHITNGIQNLPPISPDPSRVGKNMGKESYKYKFNIYIPDENY